MNTLKKDWKSSYGIGHILVTVKCLLIYPNPESALDEEAGKLLLEDYESYCARARLITSVHATPKVRRVVASHPTSVLTSFLPIARHALQNLIHHLLSRSPLRQVQAPPSNLPIPLQQRQSQRLLPVSRRNPFQAHCHLRHLLTLSNPPRRIRSQHPVLRCPIKPAAARKSACRRRHLGLQIPMSLRMAP